MLPNPSISPCGGILKEAYPTNELAHLSDMVWF